MKKYILILLLSLSSTIVFAQLIALKGKVTDAKTRLALSGVTIRVGGQSTRTDDKGLFTVKAPLKNLLDMDIDFSSIGYLNVHLIYQPDHFYEVELPETSTQLNEVTIASGEDILKKAIKQIAVNYPDRPIGFKGILRTQTWRNKTEYFRSDALINAYIPPYNTSERTTVSVLENQTEALYDKSLRYLKRVANYNVLDFQDIAHNDFILNKISKKRKFDYQLVGTQIFNNHKVFVLNTRLQDTSKNINRIDVTLYIDTATYAFVATNIYTYNWVRTGFLTKRMLNYRVNYEKIGKKWYLLETHMVSDSEYKSQSPQTIVDFVRTEIDSVNPTRIPYKDIIQEGDDVLKINKSPGKKKWDSKEYLFKEAERTGRISPIPNRLLDTIRENAQKDRRLEKTFGDKLIDYVQQDNLKATLGINKFPMQISSQTVSSSPALTYGWGGGIYFRLFKDLYLDLQANTNFRNPKKVGIYSLALNLSNDFVLNKNARSITLSPFAGFEHVGVNFNATSKGYSSFNLALRAAFEVTHKKSFFISSGFNTAREIFSLKEFVVKPGGYALGVGVLFKI
ncbi:hypothetical protein [Pedobacter borealis]|uniref:hypothetical protein n=1 Tax=Pedobacter borealis TaxID=475254 RepID=UPI0006EB8240|nr:hypothetical protein [Pedobacter borealis]